MSNLIKNTKYKKKPNEKAIHYKHAANVPEPDNAGCFITKHGTGSQGLLLPVGKK